MCFWAAVEAERSAATLRLVHVLALPVFGGPMGIPVAFDTEPLRQAAHQLLEKVGHQIRSAHPGLAIEVAVESGGSAPALLQAATSAALVVLGSRGLGALRSRVRHLPPTDA